jgi:hypothetical protein
MLDLVKDVYSFRKKDTKSDRNKRKKSKDGDPVQRQLLRLSNRTSRQHREALHQDDVALIITERLA